MRAKKYRYLTNTIEHEMVRKPKIWKKNSIHILMFYYSLSIVVYKNKYNVIPHCQYGNLFKCWLINSSFSSFAFNNLIEQM